MAQRKKYQHPIHPVFVHFPIAFLIGATILHIFFAVTGIVALWNVSIWLIGFGLITGFPTLVAGVLDFVRFILQQERDETILTLIWHIAFVAIALFLYLMLFAYCLNTETNNISTTYLLSLSLVSALTLTTGGIFGGRLVYKYGVGQPRG